MYNNPTNYTDPTGHFACGGACIGAIIGAAVGAYSGSQMAEVNDAHGASKWGYILGGAAVGAVSGGVGGAIAAEGQMTMAIVAGSATNSAGMHALSGGRTDFSVSFGAASYNFTQGELGYLGKSGNSSLQNWGYGLGALANLGDIGRALSSEGVVLMTDKSDNIGHSSTLDMGGKPLSDWGPAARIGKPGASFGKNLGRFLLKPVKGTNDYGYHGVITTVKNVNSNFAKFGGSLFQNLGLPYIGGLSNCVNSSSMSLLTAGVPNVGIHPYFLYLQMEARNSGFYAEQFSHYLQR